MNFSVVERAPVPVVLVKETVKASGLTPAASSDGVSETFETLESVIVRLAQPIHSPMSLEVEIDSM